MAEPTGPPPTPTGPNRAHAISATGTNAAANNATGINATGINATSGGEASAPEGPVVGGHEPLRREPPRPGQPSVDQPHQAAGDTRAASPAQHSPPRSSSQPGVPQPAVPQPAVPGPAGSPSAHSQPGALKTVAPQTSAAGVQTSGRQPAVERSPLNGGEVSRARESLSAKARQPWGGARPSQPARPGSSDPKRIVRIDPPDPFGDCLTSQGLTEHSSDNPAHLTSGPTTDHTTGFSRAKSRLGSPTPPADASAGSSGPTSSVPSDRVASATHTGAAEATDHPPGSQRLREVLSLLFPAFVSAPTAAKVHSPPTSPAQKSLLARLLGSDEGTLAETDAPTAAHGLSDTEESADEELDPGRHEGADQGFDTLDSAWADAAADDLAAELHAEPPCSPTALRWRVRGLALGVLALLAVLTARLWWLHQIHGQALQGLASRQRVTREPVAPRPGDILDRQGLVLATSIETRSLFVVPRKLPDLEQAAQQLAGPLGLEPAPLLARLKEHRGKGFLWIKRRLDDAEVAAIRQLGWPRDWWGLQGEFRRHHPQGTTAAHVLGQRDIDGKGRGGVEVIFDKRLRGEPGEQSLVLDARGKVLRVEPTPGREVRQGGALQLTIDTYLQWQAEELLDGVVAEWRPLSACAVVLDPWTGEVLAMASRPTYDPDRAELARPDAWTNRAIHDQYEPGSTFKPLVVAWGLERGVVQRAEQFDCENGEWRMGGRVLHDHHRYGMLDVAGILAKSSNIGMAKIGVRLGNPGLHAAATEFGFGRPTGIELPGEVDGLLRPLKKWTRYSTGSIPMGQELSATPLQMAAGFGVLAADGAWLAPHLELERTGQVTKRQVITAETARWLREGPLVDVVTKGTGKKAAIPGYAVFGKTGTAQKLDPVTGGYSRSLHVSSFVCGAPAKHPRAVVLVSVDQPSVSVNGEHFGGSVAAPAAGQLLARVLEYYKVPRDTPIPQTH